MMFNRRVFRLLAAVLAAWGLRGIAAAQTAPATAPASQTMPATAEAAGQPASSRPDDAPRTLEQCHAMFMKGRYESAAAGYQRLKDTEPLAAAVGLAQVMAIRGQYSEALSELEAVRSSGERDVQWQLTRAELLSTVGRYEDALQAAQKAMDIAPAYAPAILEVGQALETLGRKEQALQAYQSIEKAVAAGEFRRDPRAMVAVGLAMDRLGLLKGDKASTRAEHILQTYLQGAYQTLDKGYWPAQVAAGMLLLQYHREDKALKEFDQARKLNERIPEVFVGHGQAALAGMRFEECIASAEKALEINPNDGPALLLKAACMMRWRKFDQVEQIVQKTLEVNPNDLEALSMLAALHIGQGQPGKAQPYIERAGKVNPTWSGLPYTIAFWLTAGRQFDKAQPYYKEAIRLAEELAEPRAGLGSLYLQTAEEAKALEVFRQAHQIDDFREDVVNYIQLLEQLTDPQQYLVLETPHFIVKVNAEYDRVLLKQVARYLETIYPEIVADYGYEPPDKTCVEFFPTATSFSIRVTGREHLPTVGASTGKVIALAAPNSSRGGSTTHNWAVVLRHEFTHTVTLGATDNRIPHWLTEGCAVFQQPDRRAAQHVQRLVSAVRQRQLFKIADIDWSFIRPRRPGDRDQAYAQAEWMLEFIIHKKGYHPTVPDILRAFRDGKSQAQVLRELLEFSEDQFDAEFAAWAAGQVRQWGFDAEPIPTPEDALKAARENPDSPAAQANLALALLNQRQVPAAMAAVEKALQLDPDNVKALGLNARLRFQARQIDQAVASARRLEELDHTSAIAPETLARACLAKQDWAGAIAALELLKQRQPLSLFAYQQLATLYTRMGAQERALPNLAELHRLTMTDPTYARQAADILHSLSRDDESLAFYQQALYINPYDPAVYKATAGIYLRQKQYEQALDMAENLPLLEPKSTEAWTLAASVAYQAGDKTANRTMLEQAKTYAEKALEIQPDGKARGILAKIEAAMEKPPR